MAKHGNLTLCDPCLTDNKYEHAVRTGVKVEYPTAFRGDPRMTFDLCEEHLSMAHDPGNAIVVTDDGRKL